MGRKFHHEIDSLRKSGAYKEALDLARYAHSRMSDHRLLKRSYSWAMYSYLKLKCAQIHEALKQREFSTLALLDSQQSRVIEVNQLCREYRINKLLTADLCFSLILRLLCRFDVPPLGLYGLIKWSRSAGLRSEDYEPEALENSRVQREPLLLLLAFRLEALVEACAQIDSEHRVFEKLNVEDLATFTARLHIHTYEKTLGLSAQQKTKLLWNICWLYRRGQSFSEGLKWGINCFKSNYAPPSLWWEIALCLAKDHQNNETILSLENTVISHDLSSALACALHASIEAKKNEVDELQLVHLYAKSALWTYHLNYHLEARALLTIAIDIVKQNKCKIPFKWVSTLSELGGVVASPLNIYIPFAKQASLDANSWLAHQFDDLKNTLK